MEEARSFEANAPDEPSAMSVCEGKVTESIPIHIRGNHRNLGAAVGRGFPEVIQGLSTSISMPANQSGRLELARWLANRDNPLTARVIVNRIWHWHFGQGLVRTTDNFGVLGDKPSHPELLDWLAGYFIDNGYSIKQLHRLLLRSHAYRIRSAQSMVSDDPRRIALDTDPENRLRWQFQHRRLEAEQIRDAILSVAGSLDETMGGKSVPLRNRQFVFNHTSVDHTRYESLRRAIYLPVIRNNLYTLFEQFDFPDPTMPTGTRSSTSVAPQALLLLNDDLVMDAANRFAKRVRTSTPQEIEQITLAYRMALGRSPSRIELEQANEFINSIGHKEMGWQLFCHSLFASNEFIYVE